MSNEMIERVAKAIADAVCLNHDNNKDILEMYAKIAIATMREPTDQQRNEWLMMTGSVFYDITWETMIDAALKED